MQDESIPSMYEAAFTFEGIRTRVDVLVRNDDGAYDLVEVKSSTSAKAEHISDAAIQLYVLEGAGVAVSRAFVMHIDSSYVYAGGPYDLDSLFRLQDVTGPVRSYVASLPGRLNPMWETLALDDAPPIEIGPHCSRPYRCSFYGLCHGDLPDHFVEQLPGAKVSLIQQLRSLGILDIRDIPDNFAGLTRLQQRARGAVADGLPYVGDGLARAIDGLAYPLQFLDFETFNPALPVYPTDQSLPGRTVPVVAARAGRRRRAQPPCVPAHRRGRPAGGLRGPACSTPLRLRATSWSTHHTRRASRSGSRSRCRVSETR